MLKDIFRDIYLKFNLRLSGRLFVVNYITPSRTTELIRRIIKQRPNLLSFQEMYNLSCLIDSLEKVEGDIAEAGVYAGASAKLINLLKPKSKTLFLFDTFRGLPKRSAADPKLDVLKEGSFTCSYESVKKYLNDSSVKAYKGMFPQDTGKHIRGSRFSFVHLDMDLYESTRDALEFFSGRMAKQGIILCHDYTSLIGVKKAVDDFCSKSGRVAIRLSGNQVIIVF